MALYLEVELSAEGLGYVAGPAAIKVDDALALVADEVMVAAAVEEDVVGRAGALVNRAD